jgi:hypothetical protein
MKITAISVLTASLLLLGASAALAQGTTGGADTNGTTPGALSTGGVAAQSLKPTTGGQGLGYAPSSPNVGVSPDVSGSTTIRPNEAASPVTGPTGSNSGSSAP